MTRRIPRSLIGAGLAMAASLVTHMAALALQNVPDPVENEGGGGATLAMDGTSFADMAQGRLEAVSPEGAEVLRPVAAPPRERPVAPIQTPAAPIPPATASPAEAPPPTPAGPAPSERVAAAVTTAPANPSQPSAAPIPAAPAEAAPPVPTPPEAAAPAETAEPVGAPQAAEPVGAITTPRVSARPRSRPAAVTARAEAARARQPEERAAAGPVRRGNEAAADATRGTAGGSATGQAASSGEGRAQAAGNAAASNYPGQVQARILRQRMPRDAGRGIVRVSFTVAGNGGLAALGLAASSGSAALDRAAVQIVQRAAPFPAPPPGAQRTFVVPVQGR